MGDSDDSYDFSELDAFLERLRAGDELVMGNRFKGGIRPGAMPFKNRYLGNPVLSGVGRLFFGCPVGDFHCGLRAYRKDAFEKMDLRTTGMEFASEMVISATLKRMRISEVPTVLHPDGRSRPPHLRPWRDGWRHLRFMLLYSPRWLFLYPGLGLMLLGLVAGATLWAGPVRIGPVGFDIHSLVVAAAAVLVGFQSVLFGVLAKVYAVTQGFVPLGPRLARAAKLVSLEVGVLAGLALVAAGLAGLGYAVWDWGEGSFGQADPGRMMRVIVPATTALILGFQIVLSSCFLSLLVMGLRRGETLASRPR
jgi:hypothetical protein